MNPGKQFLQDNHEQFLKLGKFIRQIDTIKSVATLKEIEGRKEAIRIIKEWVAELWGVDIQDIKPEEDDDIIRQIKNANQ